MSQRIDNLETSFYTMEIPETDTVLKEKSEWFKVDLPKRIIEHKKKRNHGNENA